MSDEHIISLIENAPLRSLSESELSAIRVHAEQCPTCRQAFQAAQISAHLLQERAAAEFAPSPFFHTRVLAVLRERQAENDAWAWGRMWRAAGALASSMVAGVAALAVLTFVIPGNQAVATSAPSALAYSAEELILDQGSGTDNQVTGVSDSQVLSAIYGGEEEGVK
jgi:hypothetical protein